MEKSTEKSLDNRLAKGINLKEVFKNFDTEPVEIEAYGNGHINDTYCVVGSNYILQRINTNVFKNPKELMENIENVTLHIREKLLALGEDPDRGTLTVVPTKDQKNYYQYNEKNFFRVYRFIENTKTIEDDKTYEDLYQAGIGFGKFHRMVADFPVDRLYETIPDFHHTPKRVEALKAAIEENRAGRADSVREEIAFALSFASMSDTVLKGMETGEIPLRVTHNDTKINNILFDENTSEAVCVIDLDTVMPGSMLYDFGDALRMGGSTGAEDETDLSKVHFDVEAFCSFAKGYLKEMQKDLTPLEIKLLPFSVKLLTYECGIRFLTDYLNGDTYFKIHKEHHNLDRARNQFQLVKELDEKEQELCELVSALCN